jgi:FKBP12-rapamycin complex-associated protein
VKDLWEHTNLQLPLVSLVEALGRALDAEFKPFLPVILPPILQVFDGPLTEKRSATQMRVFDALLTFGSNLEEYLHLVIAIITKTCERTDANTQLRKRAITTIDGLSRRINFSDHASRVIQPLVRVLDTVNPELRLAAMDTLSALVVQMGPDFRIFIQTINVVGLFTFALVNFSLHALQAVVRNRISHAKYDNSITKLLNGERLPQDLGGSNNLYDIFHVEL